MPQPETSVTTNGTGRLAKGRLGVWDIVALVVSAAAPLAVFVFSIPLAVRVGGVGAPGAMVVSGILLLLFAFGFTAMTKYVRNAGAFYAYITKGLGAAVGRGMALVTTFSYGILTISFYGFLIFYMTSTASALFGLDLPWWIWGLCALALITYLGYKQINIGAKVLITLLSIEVLMLGGFAIAVLINGTPEPVTFESFSPSEIFTVAGAGAMFVVAFGAFVGFEASAIYAEEAKDPERTVPRATYIAIAFLTVIYGLMFWLFIQAFGTGTILAAVQLDSFTELPFDVTENYMGVVAVTLMRVLIVTSYFACLLAFHNSCTRYLYSLGREGLLPRILGRTHAKTQAPHIASMTLSIAAFLSLLALALFNGDPYLHLGTYTYAIGVPAIVFAQAMCGLAVTVFFARNLRGHNIWRVVIAPGLGTIGLFVIFGLIMANLNLFTGTDSTVVNVVLMLPPLILLVVGICMGPYMKRKGSALYEGEVETEDTSEVSPVGV